MGSNSEPLPFERHYALKIDPPLLNSSSPWATTLEDLKQLYDCPHTGAVTTRTSLLEGFGHDDSVHQYTFFTAGSATTAGPLSDDDGEDGAAAAARHQHHSSLNTLGYSPVTLSEYLGYINEIVGQRHLGTADDTGAAKKPWILSVTGTGDEVAMAYALVANAAEMDEGLRLNLEVNLSCPNIKGKPPPAYDEGALREFLECVGDAKRTYRGRMGEECVPRVGVKLPPYTYLGQCEMVGRVLRDVEVDGANGGEEEKGEEGKGKSLIDFVVCTNTLGACLVLPPPEEEDAMRRGTKGVLNSESGSGVGGMAGAALHPLALGNVRLMREVLDRYEGTRDILVVGVGGVEDRGGFERMTRVGAGAVGLATALGREGVGVFGKIAEGGK